MKFLKYFILVVVAFLIHTSDASLKKSEVTSTTRLSTIPDGSSDSYSSTTEQVMMEDESTEVLADSPSPSSIATLNPQRRFPPWFDQINLLDAVKMGNLDAVKYRMSIGGDNPTPHISDTARQGPIHVAAAAGELPILAYLVEKAGVPIESKNMLGQTPLVLAAESCKLDVIKYLVERGAELRGGKHFDSPLQASIVSKCFQAVLYLLEKGTGLKEFEVVRGEGNITLLHVAAASGNILPASLLLDRGAPLEAKNVDGATPAHTAILSGSSRGAAVAKYLIARGADVKTRNGNGDTLLHSAVLIKEVHRSHHHRPPTPISNITLPLVEYLIQSGVELNVRNKDNLTALELSQRAGGSAAVHEYLLKVSRNRSEYTTTTTTEAPPANSTRVAVPLEYKYMDLLEAVASGVLDAVRYRVSAVENTSASLPATDGLKPIHMATKIGNLEMVKMLVEEAGADVNSLDEIHQRTPLHYSTHLKSVELLRYLVSRGANLSARDSDGASVLHMAAAGNYLEPLEYLVGVLGAADAINAADKRGRSPLHVAVEWRNCALHIPYFLVEQGASPNARDIHGATPLARVVFSSDCDDAHRLPLIKYLVRAGADLSTRDVDGTLLHHAARPLHLSVRLLQFLVKECGVEVLTAQDRNGNTPLHLALFGLSYSDLTRAEQVELIKLFVDHGAELTAVNAWGNRPLDLYHDGNEEIKRLLTPKNKIVTE